MHLIDTLIAQYLLVISILLVGYFFIKLPSDAKKWFLIELAVGGILAIILAKIGGRLFYDPRPFVVGHFTPYFAHVKDNGFPSDHTLLSSFLGFLVLRYKKEWGYVLLFLAAVIGLSRIIAGVHHLIDIIGSFICAGLSMLLIYILSSRIQGKVTTAKR